MKHTLTTLIALTLTSITLAATSGCATLPETGVARATGAPLHVPVEYEVRDEVVKKKVGESVASSSYSDETVKVDTYAVREMRVAYERWSLAQGGVAVDEVDFYRIAGEEAVARDILAERQRIKRRSNLTAGAAVGGYALAILGAGLLYGRLFSGSGGSSLAPQAMLYGGGLVGGLSTFAWTRSGREKLTPGYVLQGRARAEQTADAYNASIQVVAPTNPEPPADADEVVTVEPGTGEVGGATPRYRILGMN